MQTHGRVVKPSSSGPIQGFTDSPQKKGRLPTNKAVRLWLSV